MDQDLDNAVTPGSLGLMSRAELFRPVALGSIWLDLLLGLDPRLEARGFGGLQVFKGPAMMSLD